MSFARPVNTSTRSFDIDASIGQTVFTFLAPLFDVADLAVLVSAAPNQPFVVASPAAYTTALTANLSQGVVTFATPPCTQAGQTVVVRLRGERTQSRLTDVTRGGTVVSKAMEDEFDRQAIILQELRRDISELAAQLAIALLTVLPVTAQAIGAAPLAPGGARRGAFLLALQEAVPHAIQDVATAIPDGPDGPVALAYADAFVEPGTALAVFVQNRYGLTAAQMTSIFAAAGAAITIGGYTVPPLT